jgi:uncharacterized protein YjbI with pentapeptide repeats
LLQVVLLARTADAYNDAVERGIADPGDRALARQRLANTLFAQMFAGSPREREGLLGFLLHFMAWVTLVIAPPMVLLVFEVKFVPFHSSSVIWIHRGLITLDVVFVFLLWAYALEPRHEAPWRSLARSWKTALGAVTVIMVLGLLSFAVVTFPGEMHANWTRYEARSDSSFSHLLHAECRTKSYFASILPADFDRLSLQGENFVDRDRISKIEAAAKANGPKPYESEWIRIFRSRELRCGRFDGADLSYVDFANADLSGADLRYARLQGANFPLARLQGANLSGAQLQRANLRGAELQDANLRGAELQDAYLAYAQLQGANFPLARLQGANLSGAQLQRAYLADAQMQGADLSFAQLQGAVLRSQDGVDLWGEVYLLKLLGGAQLQGADLHSAELQGADLAHAQLQGANLRNAGLQGADLVSARLQGADLGSARLAGASLQDSELRLALLSDVSLWRARPGNCSEARIIRPIFEARTPEVVERFIESVLANVSNKQKDTVKERLHKGLVDQKYDLAAIETHWRDCADKSERLEEAEYLQQHANFLRDLVCDAEGNRKEIATGIVRTWISKDRRVYSSKLARGLLDGKNCAATKELSNRTTEVLREVASPPTPAH